MAHRLYLAVGLILLCLLGAGGANASPALYPRLARPGSQPGAAPAAFKTLPSPTPKVGGPAILYFECDPCVVEPGAAATLRWDVQGASQAYLDGQGITAPGSRVVYPDQTTAYRLSAINADGQSEKVITVEVRGLPRIHHFTCLPCEIAKGETSTLSWDLSGATAAYLDGHGVPAPGNTLVAPDQTTTYRLVAVGESGSVERLVTVTVKEGGDPETVTRQLRQLGYDVRWVGYLPLARGGDTIAVVMVAADHELGSQQVADQYFAGLKVLYDNYPGQVLTVGLDTGGRYMPFFSAESSAWEAFLRGELDGQVLWRVARWNVWDNWTGRWLKLEPRDFVSKSFGY